ncbi:MAG: phosphohydrolase, partial [Betaproteobacteria bacterium HGW-Betaproteobacteria-2]
MKTRISGKQINMSDLMFSISEAMDVAHHKLALHQLRTAYICWKMAEEAVLAPAQIEKLFLAAMLHDIGAFTALEKISHYEFEAEDCEPHCLRGELIYRQVPWLAASAKMVRLHHTPWCRCNESIDAPDVMEAQMLMLAEKLEREIDREGYILNQTSALREKMHNMAGKIIHTRVVELFLCISENEAFWLELTAPNLMNFLKYKGPVQHIYGDAAAALKMEEFFTAIIDFRSKYTASHTAGVSSCTNSLGILLGLPESERVELELAATLHDLGKIGVPNEILEKPGQLTRQEFAMIKMHSYLTFTLLDSV